jgi:hypothetical protein
MFDRKRDSLEVYSPSFVRRLNMETLARHTQGQLQLHTSQLLVRAILEAYLFMDGVRAPDIPAKDMALIEALYRQYVCMCTYVYWILL